MSTVMTPDLLTICGAALFAVFAVLGSLAVVMRVLIRAFPQREELPRQIEPTLVAAVTEGVMAAYPGTRVTGIEELE